MKIDDAAAKLAELGNPHRLRAFRLLVRAGHDGLAVGDIQRHLGIPASTLTHHLQHLARVGLVEQVKEGRTVRCCVDYKAMDRLMGFMADNCCRGVDAERETETDAA